MYWSNHAIKNDPEVLNLKHKPDSNMVENHVDLPLNKTVHNTNPNSYSIRDEIRSSFTKIQTLSNANEKDMCSISEDYSVTSDCGLKQNPNQHQAEIVFKSANSKTSVLLNENVDSDESDKIENDGINMADRTFEKESYNYIFDFDEMEHDDVAGNQNTDKVSQIDNDNQRELIHADSENTDEMQVDCDNNENIIEVHRNHGNSDSNIGIEPGQDCDSQKSPKSQDRGHANFVRFSEQYQTKVNSGNDILVAKCQKEEIIPDGNHGNNMERNGPNMDQVDSAIEHYVHRALQGNMLLQETCQKNSPDDLNWTFTKSCFKKKTKEIKGPSTSNTGVIFYCEFCFKSFTDRKMLEGHQKSHLKKFKCDLCGSEFKQKRSLNRHKETSHSDDLPFKCGVCGLGFLCSSSHGKHLKKHSLNNFLQSCTDMSSSSVAALDKNQFNILDLNSLFKPNEKQEIAVNDNTEESLSDCFLRGKSLTREKILKYECLVCGKKFAEKVNLRAHKAIHEEKKYGCDVCGKKFNKINNLQKHRIIHTGEKPYVCPICGRDFADPSSAKRHQRTHSGLKPHECEVCGKHFSETSLLNRHKKRHMNVRPFGCHFCEKSFTDSDHLNRHLRTHTGEKPYECDLCGQRFTQSSSLNVHKQRHSGIRPFQCGLCLQEFTRALHLRKHISRLHGEDRPHKCEICGRQYQTEEELKSHQKTHFTDDDLNHFNEILHEAELSKSTSNDDDNDEADISINNKDTTSVIENKIKDVDAVQ